VEIKQTTGEEIRPAIGKLWGMLLLCLLMIPVGALIVFCWWFQVVLPGGRVLSDKAGIAGLIGIPLAIFLALVMVALLSLAKQLIIGDDCVQLVSRKGVAVHIPFQNVAETYATGSDGAEVVGFVLRDRQDPATLVPFWTKDRYEIQVLVYRKPLQQIHRTINERLAAFRARGR